MYELVKARAIDRHTGRNRCEPAENGVTLSQEDVDRLTSQSKVVYIPTALTGEQDGHGGEAACRSMGKRLQRISIGDGNITCLDLATATQKEIEDTFTHSVDLVYMECGNTFYLQYHINNSNLKSVLLPHLESGAVYVGSSAGTIVAGV